jgi:hypothetical protein
MIVVGGSKGGGNMRRERALKIVLMLVGLLFTAMVYPLVLFVKQEPALAMMMSHCCPAKISGGHSNPLKISMITHGRSRNDLN